MSDVINASNFGANIMIQTSAQIIPILNNPSLTNSGTGFDEQFNLSGTVDAKSSTISVLIRCLSKFFYLLSVLFI
jgi:hypothetical protein